MICDLRRKRTVGITARVYIVQTSNQSCHRIASLFVVSHRCWPSKRQRTSREVGKHQVHQEGKVEHRISKARRKRSETEVSPDELIKRGKTHITGGVDLERGPLPQRG